MDLIFWNLDLIGKGMAERGWKNARQLSKGAGIGYPAAWQITQGGPIGRLDTGTWTALARAFGVKHCDLLVLPD